MIASRRLCACALAAALCLAGLATTAHADPVVTYTWETLSATVNGQPSGLTASGEIILTNAGFTQGVVQVTTIQNPGDNGIASQTLNGVDFASFEMFDGPTYTAPDDALVNFSATVDGQYLDVQPMNGATGFFVNIDDTDAYAGAAGANDILSVYYGTDGGGPCNGPQFPGLSHCMVTGVFQLVPEPASLWLLIGGLGMLGMIGWRASRGPAATPTKRPSAKPSSGMDPMSRSG